jgi:hypothetical protein
MKGVVCAVVLSGLWAAGLWADEAVVLTHTQFQAVDATGEQTYVQTDRVILEGIVLNHPADLLDPEPNDALTAGLGGQWQIFVQGEGDDHAGTAVFMAQLYDNINLVWGRYSDAAFVAELTRLNAARFSPGDRVRITGLHKSYRGKNNINERHFSEPEYDFTIVRLDKGVGLPRPEGISLDQLKDDQDRFLFDPSRLSGCEYYQGRLVEIKDVWFVDPNQWGPNTDDEELMHVTDGSRLTFPVKLGRGTGIYRGSYNLTEPFDVIGIMDQEGTDLKAGYRIWVPNYDGNGKVLACLEHRLADRDQDTSQ